MLSEAEKRGCRDILKLLTEEDVLALANTITNRVITLGNREEAEKAILEFSLSAGDFLRRKKISKEVLAKYLLNKGIPFRAVISKSEIACEIIKYWTSGQEREAGLPQASNTREAGSPQASTQVALPGQPFSSSSTAPQQNGNLLSTPIYIQNNYISQTANYNVSCSVNIGGESAAISDQTQAEAFVKWFYDMLNSHNPMLNTSPKNFGPQHFWENAHLALSLVSTSSEENEIVNGNVSVAAKLLSFPQNDQLLFHPNLNNDGVAMKAHPHGPRMIFVCGMLHKHNDVVGMFQQSFGLVSDPVAPQSWKIRVSCLQMKAGSGFKSLRLAESREISAMERHTETALQQI